VSLGSGVSILNRARTGRQGNWGANPSGGRNCFLLWTLGLAEPHFQCLTGGGGGIEIKNTLSYTSTFHASSYYGASLSTAIALPLIECCQISKWMVVSPHFAYLFEIISVMHSDRFSVSSPRRMARVMSTRINPCVYTTVWTWIFKWIVVLSNWERGLNSVGVMCNHGSFII
jgi:hypothetical protein